MSVDALLTAMFPGDDANNLPGFAALGLDASALGNTEVVQTIAAALPHMAQTGAADVNETLRALRQSNPESTQVFIDAALSIYFTAPDVIRAIRGESELIFPHARSLPDIDYALLEPVIARAERRSGHNE